MYGIIAIFLCLNLSKNQMKKFSLPFLLFFIFLSTVLFSQQYNTSGLSKEITKTHYYTFEGNASQDKLDELQQALTKLEFVTEAKVKYKFEKSAGQVVLVTKEPEISREDQKGFNAPDIKRTISRLGLSPGDYTLVEKTISK